MIYSHEPPLTIQNAANLITKWAAINNHKTFAIAGIQQRIFDDEKQEIQQPAADKLDHLIAAAPVQSGLPPDFDTKSS